MIETFVLIVVAVSVHYIVEAVKEYPDYSCPPYCETDHKHVKDDKEVEL